MTRPTYDVIFYASLWICLASMPKKYRQTDLIQDVTHNYFAIGKWNVESVMSDTLTFVGRIPGYTASRAGRDCQGGQT